MFVSLVRTSKVTYDHLSEDERKLGPSEIGRITGYNAAKYDLKDDGKGFLSERYF